MPVDLAFLVFFNFVLWCHALDEAGNPSAFQYIISYHIFTTEEVMVFLIVLHCLVQMTHIGSNEIVTTSLPADQVV